MWELRRGLVAEMGNYVLWVRPIRHQSLSNVFIITLMYSLFLRRGGEKSLIYASTVILSFPHLWKQNSTEFLQYYYTSEFNHRTRSGTICVCVCVNVCVFGAVQPWVKRSAPKTDKLTLTADTLHICLCLFLLSVTLLPVLKSTKSTVLLSQMCRTCWIPASVFQRCPFQPWTGSHLWATPLFVGKQE